MSFNTSLTDFSSLRHLSFFSVAKEVGISANTLAKLSHNENVSMEIIVRICRKMNCTVDEIMDILPETMNDSLY